MEEVGILMDLDLFSEIYPGDRALKSGATRKQDSEIFTPKGIAEDMLDLLPQSVWNPETKFIDIYCKSGIFLVSIFNRLDKVLKELPDFKESTKRHNHILTKQIFGICEDPAQQLVIRRNLYGSAWIQGNISGIDAKMSKRDVNINLVASKVKETFKDMQFDVVVGNPPYNNDMYLNFVMLGHKIAKQFTLMITPAKWQAKGGAERPLP